MKYDLYCLPFDRLSPWQRHLICAFLFFLISHIGYTSIQPAIHSWERVYQKNLQLMQKKNQTLSNKNNSTKENKDWHQMIQIALNTPGLFTHSIRNESPYTTLLTVHGNYFSVVQSLHRLAQLPISINAQHIYIRARADETVDAWIPIFISSKPPLLSPLTAPLLIWNPFSKNISNDSVQAVLLKEPITHWKWMGTLTLGTQSVVWFMTESDHVVSARIGQWIGTPPEKIISISPHQIQLKDTHNRVRNLHLDAEGGAVRGS